MNMLKLLTSYFAYLNAKKYMLFWNVSRPIAL